jgi:hypothetical protein
MAIPIAPPETIGEGGSKIEERGAMTGQEIGMIGEDRTLVWGENRLFNDPITWNDRRPEH